MSAGRAMTIRLQALFMLGLLAAMVLVPTLATATRLADQQQLAVHHEDGSPCPDGDEQGPCDGNCPCLCCPGHATVLQVPSFGGLASPNPQLTPRFELSRIAPPDGVRFRIYRPPRV